MPAAYPEEPGPPVSSATDWSELIAELPTLVSKLREAKSYGGADPPTSKDRGLYLFSEGDRPIYVGRTSVTARSRKAKKAPSTSFAARWTQHCGEDSPPNSASLALKIAKEWAEQSDVAGPRELKEQGVIKTTSGWWKLRDEDSPPEFYFLFQAAKDLVRENFDFRFIALRDDIRGVRSHVLEVYADVILQTEYGDFSTS